MQLSCRGLVWEVAHPGRRASPIIDAQVPQLLINHV